MTKRDFYKKLIDVPNSNKDKCAIISDKRIVSYRDLSELIRVAYESLRGIIDKLDKNTPVVFGLVIRRKLDFLVFFMAALQYDGVIVPIYSRTGDYKIEKIIKKFDIDIIITDNEYFNGNKVKSICIGDNKFHLYLWDIKTNQYSKDVILLMPTSGTTGESKGVMLTVDNVRNNIVSITKYLKLRSDDKLLIVKNINHISTLVGEVLLGLFCKNLIVFYDAPPIAQKIEHLINKYEISVMFAVPFILDQLLNAINLSLKTIRIINFSGSAYAPEKVIGFMNRFPSINLIASYGLTEASPRVTYIERNDLLKKPESCGRAINRVNYFIMVDEKVALQPYVRGEIAVAGENIMLGYYKNPELTRKVLRNNMLYTGDIGYIDDQGYLYITGRKDNMIILLGRNIYPEEVEREINLYPTIKESLVLYDRVSHNNLVAYVVCEDKCQLNKMDLIKFCMKRLEDYKVPKKIIVVSELKKTHSGKIVRHQFEESEK